MSSTRFFVPRPECVLDLHAICGESPVWHAASEALWFVDIHDRALHRFVPSTGAHRRWSLPGRPGSLALDRAGRPVIAMERSLVAFDPDTGALSSIAEVGDEPARHRFNDGRVDLRGRFWVGMLPEALDRPSGGLLMLDPHTGRFRRQLDGFVVPNGLAFLPDGSGFYVACSRQRTIWRCRLSADGERVTTREVFARFGDDEGRPDGAALDAEGGYWIAHVLGGRITRFRPDGTRSHTLEMPVTRPTMCAFGGPDLGTLYVTSGREYLSPAELARQPLAGGLFALRPGVVGLPEPAFGGLSESPPSS